MGTRMLFSVHPGDALPIYRQIVEQVKAGMAAGLIEPGDRLPSHRDLARELVVAPLTVKRAYEVLEGEGLVTSQRGRGTFAAELSAEVSDDAEATLERRLEALVRHARLLGLEKREVLARVRAAWAESAKSRGGAR